MLNTAGPLYAQSRFQGDDNMDAHEDTKSTLVIGKCGNCGDFVTANPAAELPSDLVPTLTCRKCGATAKKNAMVTFEMENPDTGICADLAIAHP